jgi:hypothetical protein
LHENRTACLLRVRLQSLPDDSERPAAAIVLEADHALQRLAVDERIVPAPDQRPVADRPLSGKIHLLQLRHVAAGIDLLADVTITCVQHFAGLGLPAHAKIELLRLLAIEVELVRSRRGPVVRQLALGGQKDVGGVGGSRRLGQRHSLILEVIALPNRAAETLLAVHGVEKARHCCERDLVCIADPVAAQVSILGEKLRKIEIVDRCVEHRDLVLAAERYVDVESARLERLDEAATEVIRVALENEPGIDAGDRHHAADVLVFHHRIVDIVIGHVHASVRGEEPGVAAGRPVHRRIRHQAIRIEQRGLTKAHVLAGTGEIQSGPFDRRHRGDELWLAKIRRRDRARRVLQRLERLQSCQH